MRVDDHHSCAAPLSAFVDTFGLNVLFCCNAAVDKRKLLGEVVKEVHKAEGCTRNLQNLPTGVETSYNHSARACDRGKKSLANTEMNATAWRIALKALWLCKISALTRDCCEY